MKLIVGLGNPGREYAESRHNAGFMTLDVMARRHVPTGSVPRSKFHAGLHDAMISGEKCLLMQPTTYMNRSGLAVGEALRFFQLEAEQDLMVVVDDVALSCGTIRLRAQGSAGGHNGLADIEQKLSTQSYARCRVGIDQPGRIPQHDYVLGRFSPDQRVLVDEAVGRAADAVECWVTEGIVKAMNDYNQPMSETSPGSEGSQNE